MATEGWANGRVNLIGEHTDYNGGLVLPTLIPRRTWMEIRTRTDQIISLRSDAPGCAPVETSLGAVAPRHDWSDYVLGVVDVLERRGHELRGFDASVRSEVPIGAGLASSAALAVAAAHALRKAFGLAIEDREAALVAHEAEDRFVGAHVGVMDQLVCSLGRVGEALFIDTRDLTTKRLSLDGLHMEIAVIDSGIRHDNASGAYYARRQECEEAARILGVSSLRAVTSLDHRSLPSHLAKRVRHVVTENARVEAAVAAIERRDAADLGTIVYAGHRSLRDDYEVSLPLIDAIVEAAQRDPDVYGARLTGAGFGGSVLVLAKRGSARPAAERVIAAADGGARIVIPTE